MRSSTADGGGRGGPAPSAEGDLLNVVRTSPSDGTIKVGVRATTEMNVGDAAEIRAVLTSPQGALVETVLVRVTDPERTPPRTEPDVEPPSGIPERGLGTEEGGGGRRRWARHKQVGGALG